MASALLVPGSLTMSISSSFDQAKRGQTIDSWSDIPIIRNGSGIVYCHSFGNGVGYFAKLLNCNLVDLVFTYASAPVSVRMPSFEDVILAD